MSTTSPSPCERILIAIDGSKPAEWALRVGKKLAEQLCTRVMLVYVVPPEIFVSEAVELGPLAQAARKGAGLELLERNRLLLSPTVNTEVTLRLGLPGDQITAAAREWKADLIVMGTRGHGRIAQLVLGSTAEAVIRQAHCPVITVAHEPQDVHGKTEDWVGVGADTLEPISAHPDSSRAKSDQFKAPAMELIHVPGHRSCE